MTELAKPLVSVCMITYNHEKYIAQAIESVLMQEVSFKYELVIGEDCSIDDTRAIARAYSERYPDRIRMHLPKNNQGMIPNFIETLNACQGKYVAILEGDDYWIDPVKLQKQVEYLETHPNCALCFHKVLVITADKSREPFVFQPESIKEIYSLKDYLNSDLLQTGSLMFRNMLEKNFPEWFYNVPIGDWGLVSLIAKHGDLGFIDKLMGVYRLHPTSVWSAARRATQLQWRIKTSLSINAHLQFKYADIIRNRLLQYGEELMYIPTILETKVIDIPVKVDRPDMIIKRWKSADTLPSSFKVNLLSDTYGSLLFQYYSLRLWAQVRTCLAYAVRYDLSWLRYRIVWVIAADSFLGKRLANWLRISVRYLEQVKLSLIKSKPKQLLRSK